MDSSHCLNFLISIWPSFRSDENRLPNWLPRPPRGSLPIPFKICRMSCCKALTSACPSAALLLGLWDFNFFNLDFDIGMDSGSLAVGTALVPICKRRASIADNSCLAVSSGANASMGIVNLISNSFTRSSFWPGKSQISMSSLRNDLPNLSSTKVLARKKKSSGWKSFASTTQCLKKLPQKNYRKLSKWEQKLKWRCCQQTYSCHLYDYGFKTSANTKSFGAALEFPVTKSKLCHAPRYFHYLLDGFPNITVDMARLWEPWPWESCGWERWPWGWVGWSRDPGAERLLVRVPRGGNLRVPGRLVARCIFIAAQDLLVEKEISFILWVHFTWKSLCFQVTQSGSPSTVKASSFSCGSFEVPTADSDFTESLSSSFNAIDSPKSEPGATRHLCSQRKFV